MPGDIKDKRKKMIENFKRKKNGPLNTVVDISLLSNFAKYAKFAKLLKFLGPYYV